MKQEASKKAFAVDPIGFLVESLGGEQAAFAAVEELSRELDGGDPASTWPGIWFGTISELDVVDPQMATDCAVILADVWCQRGHFALAACRDEILRVLGCIADARA